MTHRLEKCTNAACFYTYSKKTNICIEDESKEYFGNARKVETILCSAVAQQDISMGQ
jgi:hypothetical protein